MNKLYLILLILLSSCSGIENYEHVNYLDGISTDSLIQISRENIIKIFSKSKHEHHYVDSVTHCIDSISHELEIKEDELYKAYQQRVGLSKSRIIETPMVLKELKELKMVESSELMGFQIDTIFIYDTIYIDSFKTIKQTIIDLELMTDKDKKAKFR